MSSDASQELDVSGIGPLEESEEELSWYEWFFHTTEQLLSRKYKMPLVRTEDNVDQVTACFHAASMVDTSTIEDDITK